MPLMPSLLTLVLAVAPSSSVFEAPTAQFKASFPCVPATSPGSNINATQEQTWECTSGKTRWRVTVLADREFGLGDAPQLFEGFRAAEAYDGRIESEKPLKGPSLVGLELQSTGKNLSGEVRHVLERFWVGKGRVWTIVVEAPGDHFVDEAAARKFVESLVITQR